MGAATYPQIVFSLGRNETRAKGAQNFGYGIFSNLIIIITIIIIMTIITIIITVSGRARPSSSSNYPLFLTGPLQEILNFNLTVLKKADAEPKKGRSKKKAIIELHP